MSHCTEPKLREELQQRFGKKTLEELESSVELKPGCSASPSISKSYYEQFSESFEATRPDAAVPGRLDADVADFDAGHDDPSIIEPIELATDAA